jgi:hypothetical protein
VSTRRTQTTQFLALCMVHISMKFALRRRRKHCYRLTQLPGAVFELPHLQVLDLSGACPANTSPSIHDKCNTRFSLCSPITTGNSLQEIPEDVVKLASLKVLDMTNNPISGVPKSVARHFYGATEIRWDGAAVGAAGGAAGGGSKQV